MTDRILPSANDLIPKRAELVLQFGKRILYIEFRSLLQICREIDNLGRNRYPDIVKLVASDENQEDKRQVFTMSGVVSEVVFWDPK